MLLIYPYVIETAIWLIVTAIITLWATRIYIHSLYATTFGKLSKGNAAKKPKAPFVTILLPMYNEPSVVNRLLDSVTSIDYPNYEIIVADDSTDNGTIKLVNKWQAEGKVKVVHRDRRSGFKAGALNNAIKHTNPKSKYFAVFDADYTPVPDTLCRMVNGFSDKDVAVVQGYAEQKTNSAKNILTKSVSTGFSSYYLVDVASRTRLNGFVPIFGTVFMIKRSALKDVGGFNESSITEDWDLASKLSKKGYRIIFDESIRVSGEAPETPMSLIRQQIRWAEGIVRDTRHNLLGILASRKVGLLKKIDYVFYGFGSFNCIFGSISYSITLATFLIGLGLITGPRVDGALVLWFGPLGSFALYFAPLYITISIILAASVALYRENRLGKFHWIAYMLVINTLLVPFIAYAGLRGLLLEKGSWSRTPKTGVSLKE